MAIQMTREEYERTYGVKPFASTPESFDTKPAPFRMTQAEYNSIYGSSPTTMTPTLGSKLMGRAKDAWGALWPGKEKSLVPGRSMLRIGGAAFGAASDVVGAAIAPAFEKTVDVISDIPMVQKAAGAVSGGLDVTNEALTKVGEKWTEFETKNPEFAQDLRDVTNIVSWLLLR